MPKKGLEFCNLMGAGHLGHYILLGVEGVPERLGKYHILALIAQGGMAEVYKAKTVGIAGFEKVLALKRIRPRYASEDRFIRNFIDEARIAVSLNHRNIVQVFDFGKADGELFLAMELLEGVDLRMAVREAKKHGQQMPPALSCYILADVAAGLDYAHRKCDSEGNALGIVHCDVSPHNILLSTEGFVKILDFGVARARFVAAPTSKRLRGKPRYMAPEQTLGDSPSAASDVFVVGILAWELLVGRQLFDGKELRDILEAVRHSEVEPVSELRPDLPDYLSDAVMRALNRNPAERGTAADIGTQLARAGRDLSNESSAQALSEWLQMMFPPQSSAEETITDLKAASHLKAASQFMDRSSKLDEGTITQPKLVALTEEIEASDHLDDTADTKDDMAMGAPALAALIDKRRVVVTILMLDGGTETRRRELSRALGDLAYKRGAVLHERNDHEIIAIFGLEVAGEDDVASAMQFAIDAAELTRDAADQGESSQPITVRSASRAGVVAQRTHGDYQLRGDALREARELARGAEPNRPLLSGGTGRSASTQFRFRELPAKRYRSRRLRVLELIGPSDHNDRAQALRARRGRFVGRSVELNTLWSAYEASRGSAQPKSVIISGGAGVGKSRLVAEFVARLDTVDEEPLLIAIAATDHAADAPFTVAIDYVQSALKVSPGRGEIARANFVQRLASTLRDRGLSVEKSQPACHAVEQATQLRDGALSGQNEASAALRERCAESLRDIHHALAGGRASVIILDNFHLADAASLDVLHSILSKELCVSPTLLVMTCRDEASLSDLFPQAQKIAVIELDEAHRALLIADRLADARTDELVRDVERRAGGNPLFIEELCRNICDVGWDETPATVRDTVVARIDRLSGRSRAVLQRAAVIGGTFRARILQELIAAPTASHLQELVEEGLLVRSDQAEHEAEDGEFSFRHGLIEEVVYASLSAGARKNTHAKLGKLLSLRDEAGRDEPPALTARHLELGGILDESAAHWTKAGRVALAAFETHTARDAFDNALAINRKLKSKQRLACRAQQVEALFGRARAYRDLGDYDSQGKDLLELEPLVVDDLPATAELLNRVAERHLRNGAFEKAMAEAHNAMKAASAANAPLAEGEALRVLGEALERTGNYDEGLEATGQALAIFQRLSARTHEARARISIARSHLVRARYAEARGIYQPILAQIQRNRDPWIERIANNHLAVIHLCLGEFEDAMRCAERSVLLCQQDGDKARAGDNLSVCGLILSEVGQHEQARERFQQSIELHKSTKSRWSQADCLVYAGYNEAILGDTSTALEHLHRALEIATELKTPYIQCNAGIALAGVHLMRNQEDDAEIATDYAEEAVRIAREATLTGAEAMALSRQAEGMRRRGQEQEGYSLSRMAVAILDRQRNLEGCEEEILYHHYRLLDDCNSPKAKDCLERALASLERKLGGIEHREWRRTFCEEVPTNIAILAASEELTA